MNPMRHCPQSYCRWHGNGSKCLRVNGDVIGFWHRVRLIGSGKLKSSTRKNLMFRKSCQMELRDRLAKYEIGRINYKYNDIVMGAKDLVKWVASLPGPRMVILNTVQSAAVVASEYERCFNRSSVEHLSTALTPSDRDKTLARIKSRLKIRMTKIGLYLPPLVLRQALICLLKPGYVKPHHWFLCFRPQGGSTAMIILMLKRFGRLCSKKTIF